MPFDGLKRQPDSNDLPETILCGAYELLKTAGWTRGAYSCSSGGSDNRISFRWDPGMRYCAVGALIQVYMWNGGPVIQHVPHRTGYIHIDDFRQVEQAIGPFAQLLFDEMSLPTRILLRMGSFLSPPDQRAAFNLVRYNDRLGSKRVFRLFERAIARLRKRRPAIAALEAVA